MKHEYSVKPVSGYVSLPFAAVFLAGAIVGFAFEIIWLGAIPAILFVLTVLGFTIVYPNGS